MNPHKITATKLIEDFISNCHDNFTDHDSRDDVETDLQELGFFYHFKEHLIEELTKMIQDYKGIYNDNATSKEQDWIEKVINLVDEKYIQIHLNE